MASIEQEPVLALEVMLQAKTSGDEDTLRAALDDLVIRDHASRVSVDLESGILVLSGRDESHLNTLVGQLKQIPGLNFDIGAPQVAYREALGCKVEVDHTHTMEVDGSRQFAGIKLLFQPGAPDWAFEFENKLPAGAVPGEYIEGVVRGLETARNRGLIAGFPVADFTAILLDASWRENESSTLAFEIVAQGAFRELRERGELALAEPYMRVEILTPEASLRSVLKDLAGRRAEVRSVKLEGEGHTIVAVAPLAEMLGYARQLMLISRGQARHTMAFNHYGPLPRPDDDPTFSPAIGMRA